MVNLKDCYGLWAADHGHSDLSSVCHPELSHMLEDPISVAQTWGKMCNQQMDVTVSRQIQNGRYRIVMAGLLEAFICTGKLPVIDALKKDARTELTEKSY